MSPTTHIMVLENDNCAGMSATEFVALSDQVSSPELIYNLDDPDPQNERVFRVIGWTLTDGGRPYDVTIVRARGAIGRTGTLIYGGTGAFVS